MTTDPPTTDTTWTAAMLDQLFDHYAPPLDGPPDSMLQFVHKTDQEIAQAVRAGNPQLPETLQVELDEYLDLAELRYPNTTFHRATKTSPSRDNPSARMVTTATAPLPGPPKNPHGNLYTAAAAATVQNLVAAGRPLPAELLRVVNLGIQAATRRATVDEPRP